MFAKGEFDKKINAIFHTFDTDNNNFIDKKEFLIFMNTGIFGLCKLVKLPLPRCDEVQKYSYMIFK